uniref:Peptide N-acetyl-beta-D-glucosaminyl asparaginase amidase A N-terminal domain-containing protein n=1 Tax=Solanum lycopersicum TaxID=4081 RepID=K4C5P5_SOLLC
MSNLQLFFFLIVIIINFINAPICSSLQHPSHFIRHGYFQQKYLEINRPLPFANLTPSCTLPILSHHFGDTIGLPPVSVAYAPPENCSWNHVALQFNASSNGVQYDRIAAVWLDGADLLRTSTAEPTESGGFWTVTKDVTRYSSLLAKQDISLSVMMENIVNDVYTGAYYVNLTILYYYIEEMNVPLSATRNNRKVRMVDDVFVDNSMSLYEKPADLIIPISGYNRGEGFWFRIRSDSELKGKSVIIPKNTYRAVMEICVSFHGLDEFWYSNPPDSYIRANNLTSQRGHGSYREVLLNIDRNLVGSVVPFPVIYPGGINPLYWDPIVSIGAFDHPSYDIDITPFLGDLLDGKSHFMGFKVLDSLPFWLLDANIVVSETGTKISHTSMKREYPLTITTKTWKPSREDGTIIMHSELEHERNEEKNWSNGHSHSYSSRLKNGQKCKGWMSVKDRIVLQGGATTEQSYSYNGEASTYSREIAAANGKLVHDTATYSKFPSVSAM